MKKILGLSLTLILVSMLFIGCGGGGDDSTTATSSTPPTSTVATTTKATTSAAPTTTTAAPTTTTAASTPTTSTSAAPTTTTSAAPTTTSSGDALADVFSKAAGINSMYCEVTMTSTASDFMPYTMKQWVKEDKLKMEMTTEGVTTIMIFNGQDMYMYYPEENYAIKMTSEGDDTYDSALDETEAMEDYDPVLVGSETVDGKDCYVFEYSSDGASTKIWLWKQYGLPVKMTLTDSSGTTTMLYKNYSFNNIADSEFELPAGVEVMDMSDMYGMTSYPGM